MSDIFEHLLRREVTVEEYVADIERRVRERAAGYDPSHNRGAGSRKAKSIRRWRVMGLRKRKDT